ncbi:hypothetical protein DB346_09805 [Verrucomicrobia bacterium LW23]|nr:hypothetical protein DB346_09805 [Verrucomicrobia bacterium LW23]
MYAYTFLINCRIAVALIRKLNILCKVSKGSIILMNTLSLATANQQVTLINSISRLPGAYVYFGLHAMG